MIKSAIALAAAAPLMAAPALAVPTSMSEGPTQVGLAMTTPEQPLISIWDSKVKVGASFHTMFILPSLLTVQRTALASLVKQVLASPSQCCWCLW